MFSMRPTSTTPPTDEDDVSMSGVAPLTVTDSCRLATFIGMLTSRVCPTFSTMPLPSKREKPCSSAVMS